MNWLFFFAFVVAFLVVFGGIVRLTRSGLSIVEWNPVSGVVPPIGEKAWAEEFAKYQQTPEYQHINSWMTLDDYRFIFWLEWIHRFVARLAGLTYAIPVFYFLFSKAIPWREFGVYFLMGALFIGQAFMGWYMVASGLVDRPAVDHFRLTIHLLFALTLLGLALWTAFGHRYGFPASAASAKWSPLSKLALASFVVLLIQISYGGLVAGLKAGHVSNTWPLMLGQWIPKGIFGADGFNWPNLFEVPQTVVYIHRWFAFLGLILVPLVLAGEEAKLSPRNSARTGLADCRGHDADHAWRPHRADQRQRPHRIHPSGGRGDVILAGDIFSPQAARAGSLPQLTRRLPKPRDFGSLFYSRRRPCHGLTTIWM